MGGYLSDGSIELIVDSIKRNHVTVSQAEEAIKQVFDEVEYRPTWAQILQRIKNPNNGVIDGGTW